MAIFPHNTGRVEILLLVKIQPEVVYSNLMSVINHTFLCLTDHRIHQQDWKLPTMFARNFVQQCPVRVGSQLQKHFWKSYCSSTLLLRSMFRVIAQSLLHTVNYLTAHRYSSFKKPSTIQILFPPVSWQSRQHDQICIVSKRLCGQFPLYTGIKFHAHLRRSVLVFLFKSISRSLCSLGCRALGMQIT